MKRISEQSLLSFSDRVGNCQGRRRKKNRLPNDHTVRMLSPYLRLCHTQNHKMKQNDSYSYKVLKNHHTRIPKQTLQSRASFSLRISSSRI